MNFTKLILATSVIVLLGIGCAKAPSTNSNANINKPAIGTSRAMPASGEFTIGFNEYGEFDPVTTFVKIGTTVTFMNNTNKTHSIVPIEDAGKKFDKLASNDIAPGEKFTIAMDELGRWYFSDGANPAFSGAIEVSE